MQIKQKQTYSHKTYTLTTHHQHHLPNRPICEIYLHVLCRWWSQCADITCMTFSNTHAQWYNLFMVFTVEFYWVITYTVYMGTVRAVLWVLVRLHSSAKDGPGYSGQNLWMSLLYNKISNQVALDIFISSNTKNTINACYSKHFQSLSFLWEHNILFC